MATLLEHERSASAVGEGSHREWLLQHTPMRERLMQVAGVPTSVLEGGEGPPVVFLHGPGEFALRWFRMFSELVDARRVIAPDLPGHGSSALPDSTLSPESVFRWLESLIEGTCDKPPVLVGHLLGGSIAARFARLSPDRIGRLVLVDTFGLKRLRPSPRFAVALARFLVRPGERSYESFMNQCLYDPGAVRAEMRESWDPLRTYSLDLARSPEVKSAMRMFMRELGVPAIPPAELAQIRVPTSLIWGRHDRANRVGVARAASERYGWPLTVIENAADDPPFEQPAAFAAALLRSDEISS